MFVSGYYGESVFIGDFGLSVARNSDTDALIRGNIQTAQVVTVIIRFADPVVHLPIGEIGGVKDVFVCDLRQ